MSQKKMDDFIFHKSGELTPCAHPNYFIDTDNYLYCHYYSLNRNSTHISHTIGQKTPSFAKKPSGVREFFSPPPPKGVRALATPLSAP
jgi:hypothetical protein